MKNKTMKAIRPSVFPFLSLGAGLAIPLLLCATARPFLKRLVRPTGNAPLSTIKIPPALTDFPRSRGIWTDADFGGLRASLPGVSTGARLQNLDRSLLLPPVTRRAALALQLSHWASLNAGEAVEWMMDHTFGEERDFLFREIGLVWAARNAKEFGAWMIAQLDNHPGEARVLCGQAAELIHPLDPQLYAEILDHPAAEKAEFEKPWGRLLPSVAELASAKKYAAAAEGKMKYSKGAPEIAGKIRMAGLGWNSLAEAAAIRWNLLDPAGCGEWLNRQPDIDRENLMAAIEEHRGKPAAAPPKARGEPAKLFLQTDLEAVPSPADFLPYQIQWAEWWHREPVQAETFLTKSAWPEDLKFRARAKAYSSASPH